MGWGEVTDIEPEWSVRDWLVGKDEEEDDKEVISGPQESHNIGEGVGVKTTAKTEKMKQLEFSFRNETGRVFAMESVEEVVAKTRMSKEDKLKLAAVGTKASSRVQ